MKISFFGFHLLEIHGQPKWYLDARHFIFRKKKLKYKALFGHFEQSRKCSVFTFVQYIFYCKHEQ